MGNMFLKLSCILCMIGVLDATTTPKTKDCYTQPPGRGSNNPVLSCLDKYAIVPGHLNCHKSSSFRPMKIQDMDTFRSEMFIDKSNRSFSGFFSGSKVRHSSHYHWPSSLAGASLATTEQVEIENKHNEIRSNVTPKARNMLTVNYNRGLERTAHIWAQKCELKSSEPLQRYRPGAFTVGENVYVSSSNLSWSDVIDKWAEEKSAFTFGSAGIILKSVSNYIQLVWATTSTIGCSTAVCAGQYFYVCHYTPSMDYDNYSTPYESSTHSCSGCKHCTNSLCDCSAITCLNGAELNLQTCQCECIAKVSTYVPPLCELHCERNGDDPSCGIVYQKTACRRSFETMFHCPWMCDLCPYAGRNYTERSQPLPWERNRTECPEHTTDFKTTTQARRNGSSRKSFPHSTVVFVFMLTLFCITK